MFTIRPTSNMMMLLGRLFRGVPLNRNLVKGHE